MKTGALVQIDVSAEEAEAVLLEVKANCDEKTYQLIKALFGSYQSLLATIKKGKLSIKRLKKLIFGMKSEKMDRVVSASESAPTPEAESVDNKAPETEAEQEQASCETSKPPDTPDNKPKRPGHGRRGANGYPGAQRIVISHPTLKSGDPCPECEEGKVYDNVEPCVILRFTGQPPIKVTVWELEKLRCNLCGILFTAPPPEEMGSKRWDETAQAIIALERYGAGMPFCRQAKLQSNLGMPIPASTKWEAVKAGAELCKPAHVELVRQAAQGQLLHNDDTSNRILDYMKGVNKKAAATDQAKNANTRLVTAESPSAPSDNASAAAIQSKSIGQKDIVENDGMSSCKNENVQAQTPINTQAVSGHCPAVQDETPPEDINNEITLSRRKGKETNPKDRKGVHTTGIISECNGKKIALFFTGKKHAGENLDDVLEHRAQGLSPPTLMCDALMRNLPKRLAVLLANCLAHARRKFVEIFDEFPEHCRHLIEQLALVYHHDDIARQQAMSDKERLAFHQSKSKKIMDDLKEWLDKQIVENLVEPNSDLGKSIAYMRNHWDALTLFLKVAGCPLDNNLVERALKKAILSRKNSMFFKTQNGADVCDIYTSLIHTCELNGINAFDYLTSLMRHSQDVKSQPSDWMPWNYQQTLRHKQAT